MTIQTSLISFQDLEESSSWPLSPTHWLSLELWVFWKGHTERECVDAERVCIWSRQWSFTLAVLYSHQRNFQKRQCLVPTPKDLYLIGVVTEDRGGKVDTALFVCFFVKVPSNVWNLHPRSARLTLLPTLPTPSGRGSHCMTPPPSHHTLGWFYRGGELAQGQSSGVELRWGKTQEWKIISKGRETHGKRGSKMSQIQTTAIFLVIKNISFLYFDVVTLMVA